MLGILPEATKWRFILILAYAGELNAEGYLIDGDRPLTTERIAWRLHVPVEELTNDLKQLKSIGVIARDEDI